MQHGGAHVGPDAPPLMGAPDPRTALHRAEHFEVHGEQLLHADEHAILEHREREVPLGGRQIGAPLPIGLQGLALQHACRLPRPRHTERHRRRVVDALRRQVGEPGDELVVGIAQLEARRRDRQIEERPVPVEHGPWWRHGRSACERFPRHSARAPMWWSFSGRTAPTRRR